MNSADRERVKELLARAARLPPQDRVAFIRRATADDPQAAAEAIDLLATLDDPLFMSAPTGVGMAAALPGAALPGESPGTVIDRYKLLQLIGEGGFGSVYLAEQTQPVQRRVALKIIKAGMDTKQVIARFEAERQALALMEHPNIARVLDAGATAGGRPYFVMELVRGEPVTRYSDRERLPIRKRLALFQSVCHAVQHAHQKGIIHRDLKPSNIMVTVADGEPLPKVIDFGIAKATEVRLTDKTLFTEMHQLIGTPEYMSPEQAEVSGVDIDTRSDIYSLGVLLYELLTGSTPLERGRLRATPLVEVQRLIREEEPLRPSLRLATLGSSAQARFATPLETTINHSDSSALDIARRRQSDPLQLTRTLRGDLDWIVLKCLEKDRRRRYATAGALADDIGRYLDDQPVLATPPDRVYAIRKFVRRNRGAVMAALAISTTLLIATGVSLVFALNAARERASAEMALERTEKAEAEAMSRAGELEIVAAFQEKQLSGIDAQRMGSKLRANLIASARAAAERSSLSPDQVDDRVVELEALISRIDFTGMAQNSLQENFFQPALAAIDEQVVEPLVRARLLQTIASTLHKLGLYDAANAPQEEVVAIRRRELGDDHPDTLDSMSNLGFLLMAQGKLAVAEPHARTVLDVQRRVLGPDDPDTLISVSNLGLLLQAQGKLAEAESYHREAMEKRRQVLGNDHPDTLAAINNMGFLLQARGRLEDAEPYFRESLAGLRRVWGDEHVDTLVAINNMGALLYVQGKFEKAETYFREALGTSRQVLGADHRDTLRAMDNLAVVLRAQERLAEAEVYCRESMEKHRSALGNDHPDTLISIGNLGVLLVALGKLSEAEPFQREALEASRRVLGDDHPETLRAVFNMGNLLVSAERYAEAEGYVLMALERQRQTLGDGHPQTLASLGLVGKLLNVQGNARAAVDELAPAEQTARRVFVGGNLVRLGRFLTTLGCARVSLGELDLAETNLSEAQSILSEAGGATDRDRIEVWSCLIQLYETWNTAEPGQGFDDQAAAWRNRLPP